ncbi:hypothetical protein F4604DRAFT_1690071 [Suillus subluteus]|nr:hypothetical protein F4604DRAFT_1690071 [Suillus subluteus]
MTWTVHPGADSDERGRVSLLSQEWIDSAMTWIVHPGAEGLVQAMGLTRIIFTISQYLPFVGAGLTAYAVNGSVYVKSKVTIIVAVAVNFSPNHQLIPGAFVHLYNTCCFNTGIKGTYIRMHLRVIKKCCSGAAYRWFHDCWEIWTPIVTTGSMLYMLCIIGIQK